MSRRTLLIVLAVVVAVALLAGGYAWWQSRQPSGGDSSTVTTQAGNNRLVITEQTAPVAPTPATATTLTATDQEQLSLERLGFIFAERFGSYATGGDYSNVSDLFPLMTPSLQTWATGYIAKNRTTPPSEQKSITTKALAVAEKTVNSDDATLVIATQRRETSGGDPVLYKQNIKLTFKRLDGTWLVDGVYWQ